MLGDLSGVQKIYLVTGRTDMRKSFDGLMSVIRDTYQMDPYANAVYLFWGRKRLPGKLSTSTKSWQKLSADSWAGTCRDVDICPQKGPKSGLWITS